MNRSRIVKYAGVCLITTGVAAGGAVLAQGQGNTQSGAQTEQRSDHGNMGWAGLLGLLGLLGLRGRNRSASDRGTTGTASTYGR